MWKKIHVLACETNTYRLHLSLTDYHLSLTISIESFYIHFKSQKLINEFKKRDERDPADYKHPRIGTRLPVELSAFAEESKN